MVDWSDGALWVGATNGNHIWGQVTDARDAGSPVWQPAYDGGESVRFSTRGPDPNDLPEAWDGPADPVPPAPHGPGHLLDAQLVLVGAAVDGHARAATTCRRRAAGSRSSPASRACST